MKIAAFDTQDWPGLWVILEPMIRAGETYALPRDMSEEAARNYWCGPDRAVFVAWIEDVVVGSYFLRANQLGPGAHVSNAGYAVHPDQYGKGIARALCRHSLETAQARGYRAMQYNFVVSSNVRAVALWEQMGFFIVGTLPDAFQHPTLGLVDAYAMYRSL